MLEGSRAIEPVTPKLSHKHGLGDVPYCFGHDFGKAATEGYCDGLWSDIGSELMNVLLLFVVQVVVRERSGNHDVTSFAINF